MKKVSITCAVLAALAVISCVTINIYFPAEEVRSAADKIVSEVYGEGGVEKPAGGSGQPEPKDGSSLWDILGPRSAYAVQQADVDISTPEIRAIRQAMKARNDQLRPYLDAGHIGIGLDGFLKVRTTDGLGLRERAEVNRLVNAENDDRRRLYEEIAQANNFPEKVDEVQEIFARTWREKAQPGWYLEQPGSGWKKK